MRGGFAKGRRVDRYEIREHLGQGGMGAVYRAVDTKLGRTVALKTVAAFRRGDKLTPEIRERFLREALAASRVDHRNVVQVLDFGVVDDGTPYMVMEFLRGRRLSDLLAGAPGPLPIDGVTDIMLSVCAALRACHLVGIVHRDLKPANVFLCDTDTGWEIKVLDFGISRAPAADELTQDGQISIGTPHYFSPEQIDGAARPESDQYALGVLLYVCLTGRLPFAGHQGARLLRAISEGRVDPPRALRPDLPAGLQAIILRALHVSPSERFESIHALGQRLWEFASPRGQAQWKAFYFQTPPPSFAPGETGLGEARPRIDPTASLAPVAARAAPASQATVGPAAYAVTRTAAAPGLADANNLSHSDIAGESALSAARDGGGAARSGGAGRWGVALVAAVAVGAGVFAIRHASRPGRPAAAGAAGVVVAPAAPSPPPSATAPSPTPPAPPPPPPPARADAATATVKDAPPPAASQKKRAAKPHRRGSRN
ncbi:MAG TPA: serine/threonine-protein kinase [Polyangia bacterium]